MQQTQKYKLNLIETSDTFSPAPLNENIQKLEDIVAAGADAESKTRADADAALDARVTVLEAHKLATGTYAGTAGTNDPATQFIPLPFTPQIVYVHGGGVTAIAIPDVPSGSVRIMDGGFQVNGSFNRNSVANYPYFAIC